MKTDTRRRVYSFAGLYLSLAFPSIGQVHKHFGSPGLIFYALAVFAGILILWRLCARTAVLSISDRQGWMVVVFVLVCLFSSFLIVYPAFNKTTNAAGSDRDDEINIATGELLNLRYPYYKQTYLGNSFSHLPGAFLLAVPFVVAGNCAYQNFFWLFVYFLIARLLLGNIRLALGLFLAVIIASPVVLHEILTGGDLLSNSIYILSLLVLAVYSVSSTQVSEWKRFTILILFGIALSSRANFLLLLPLFFSALFHAVGYKSAVRYIGIVCASLLVITLPFYVYQPGYFSPLKVQLNKLFIYYEALSSYGVSLALAAVVLALMLSIGKVNRDCFKLLRNCFWVQLFLVLSAVLLGLIRFGCSGLIFSGYGLSFLFFGALVFWKELNSI